MYYQHTIRMFFLSFHSTHNLLFPLSPRNLAHLECNPAVIAYTKLGTRDSGILCLLAVAGQRDAAGRDSPSMNKRAQLAITALAF